MCKEVEAVLEEKTEMPISCEVNMDGEGYVSDDFVAILAKPNGDLCIYYNTDAITLGMSMKMIAKAFVDSMNQLSEEERTQVSEILGGNFEVGEESHEEN